MDVVRVEKPEHYEMWTISSIRHQLAARGLSIKGDWNTKIDRLIEDDEKHEAKKLAVIHPRLVERKPQSEPMSAWLTCPNCHLSYWWTHLEDYLTGPHKGA